MIKVSSTATLGGMLISEVSTGTVPEYSELLNEFIETTIAAQRKAVVAYEFTKCSQATGDYVVFRPDLSFCPAIIGNDGRPVFVYRFIEILDEVLDYAKVMEELPTLSFAQINGTLSFLRKVVQYNVNDIDIDEEFQKFDLENEGFITQLRAVVNEEATRVLNFGK